MTHVSRKKIDGKIQNKILDFLVIALTEVKSESEMRLFLDSFFTSTEKIMLAKRLGIVYFLKENVPAEKIAEVLSVTPATVFRMKLWLKVQGEGYALAIKILEKNQNFQALKQFLWQAFDGLTKSSYRRIRESRFKNS